VVQLKKDSYQGIASAMPATTETKRLSAAEPRPAAAADEAGHQSRVEAACLKACPDTNLFQNAPSRAPGADFLKRNFPPISWLACDV